MDPPMVEWFQPVNNGLDSVTNAVKFQFDMLASLVRYYKGKCIHQRQLVERIKDEATEARMLRKTVEELKLENHQLRQYAGFGDGQPSEFTNLNGKRPMTDAYSSVATPLGPNRLTLPPDHQQPKFSQHISEGGRSSGSNSGTPFVPPEKRPGSSRFAQYGH
ncbi:hypothetical protein EWM64_g318 [Hericium alpestre]|uniref:Uncharacterized protein n=1 Tax=Hericium alpestre TaxID=135208 RepID=A0A4Z0ACZ6_9AGAM|nr:hypothetical protein EWM64_g318 [Hericium alpestre]